MEFFFVYQKPIATQPNNSSATPPKKTINVKEQPALLVHVMYFISFNHGVKRYKKSLKKVNVLKINQTIKFCICFTKEKCRKREMERNKNGGIIQLIYVMEINMISSLGFSVPIWLLLSRWVTARHFICGQLFINPPNTPK